MKYEGVGRDALIALLERAEKARVVLEEAIVDALRTQGRLPEGFDVDLSTGRVMTPGETSAVKTWKETSGFAAVEAVRSVDGCGQVNEEQTRVCLMPSGHESPCGWESR